MLDRSLPKAGLLATFCALALATAAQADSPQPIDVPAGDLATALKSLSQQVHVNLVYTPEGVRGLKTSGVNGSLTAVDAVRKLLEGTGLKLSTDASTGAMLIVRDTQGSATSFSPGAGQSGSLADTIETVNVFGTLENELSVGSKSGQSLRETPKSVTIVTRERIEAQNLMTVTDALTQATGVTIVSYSGSSERFIFSRGFQVNTLQIDGGAAGVTGSFGSNLTPDTAVYERVEMLRGVDGMFTGAGEPGGVINLVRKRAKATPEVQVNVSAGSWNNYRGEFDFTGPLTDDGRWRGRAVAAYQNSEYYYDRASSDRKLLFATTEYDLTDSTLLIAGASYERSKEDNYWLQGMPRYSDGRSLDLPRSTAFNPDWNHRYVTSKEVFARVEQKFGDTGVVKLNYTHTEQETDRMLMATYGSVDPVTLTGTRALGSAGHDEAVQDLLDLSVNGFFNLFGREHRYTVGTDYTKVDGSGLREYTTVGYLFNLGPAVNVFDFDPSLYPKPEVVLNGLYPVYEQTQQGYYATIGLQLAEPLRLTLGGRYGEFRYDRVRQAVLPTGAYGAQSVTKYKDSAFIPSAALTWDFAEDWTSYASYAQTFKVQASSLQGPLPGTPLDPITGDGYELGVKGEVLGFLNTALAVYRINRDGQGVRDPSYPVTPGANGASCCFIQQANITTEGIDAEVSGTVLPGWQMFAGYTHTTSDFEGGRALGVYYLNMTPKNLFKLWTTWQLPGNYSRWSANAGVIAQSKSYISGTVVRQGVTGAVPFEFTQSSYAVWNASLKYQLSDTWSIGLYGDNLLDKKYYQLLGSAETQNGYGAPRSFMLTVRGHW
ncbi:TonB-dependent siderophore receptor [Steroidobacter sp.]|uniref:TonB-dependent siderophore receptor n=1 Tax=Steroidobacter sp. TaxID=1978227 RepID=UPI001A52BECB|nr:TonB-dependent receptor [Steroidobacter sp.]MBL8267346.1 TonB-dependent siderophore receptor [Steroidobacter sp.]